MQDSITIDDIQAAANRLNNIANRTPVLTSRTINKLTNNQVFFSTAFF